MKRPPDNYFILRLLSSLHHFKACVKSSQIAMTTI